MNVLISHQTGATMSVLSLQMMQFTPMLKVCTTSQNAKKQTPMFQDRRACREKGKSTRTDASKLAMGTRG